MSAAEQFERKVYGNREVMLDSILRDAILERDLTPMQVDDNCARILQMITLISAPRHVVEVGTYFGYSAIHIARGLPVGGRLTTIEQDPELAEIAKRNLDTAGVADRVDVVVGPGFETLETFELESLDMVFIDADKAGYPDYLKAAFPRLRPGGIIIADDVFATGDYSHESAWTPDVREVDGGLRKYVVAAGRSPRLFSTFIGTRYGLMVSRKLDSDKVGS